jgi:hypothetical protein
MLGMAQFEAQNRGMTLTPDSSLSRHSVRLVGKLRNAGLIEGPPPIQGNDLEFSKETQYPSQHDWARREVREETLSPKEVARGGRAGRAIVSRLNPKPEPEYEQSVLFDRGPSQGPQFHRQYTDAKNRDRVILGGHLRRFAPRPD